MKYFEDMTTKWGFSDGEATPPDACACRYVYAYALNLLLDKYNSDYRVVAFDRPGCHNGCMLLAISKTDYDKIPRDDRLLGSDLSDPNIDCRDIDGEFDDGWRAAMEDACEMDLDEFVITKVEIDHSGLERLEI